MAESSRDDVNMLPVSAHSEEMRRLRLENRTMFMLLTENHELEREAREVRGLKKELERLRDKLGEIRGGAKINLYQGRGRDIR